MMPSAQFDKIISQTRIASNIMELESSLEMYQMLLSKALMLPTTYDVLGIKPVNKGLCKWLGAWGGDMMLINKTKRLDTQISIFYSHSSYFP